ncbi:hypothetical protein TcWFU_008624 [Taenia crassiceps]|uniref:Uncharacterized protein n=1 Tax=Taenia crassiceps TaxID=6207 RepID=A0ABR4QSU4_9CEST
MCCKLQHAALWITIPSLPATTPQERLTNVRKVDLRRSLKFRNCGLVLHLGFLTPQFLETRSSAVLTANVRNTYNCGGLCNLSQKPADLLESLSSPISYAYSCGDARFISIMIFLNFNSVAPVTGVSRFIILPPPFCVYEIDRSGYRVVAHHLYRHIILQEAMSWLSTLGGGFSCLGDKCEDAAEIAGEISLRQMYLALSMEIPVFQARCRLFFAQSLMQRGRLKAAGLIIRDVYSFSKSASAYDNPPEVHLGLMCHGLWKRLSHLWSLRRSSRQLVRPLRLHLHTDGIGTMPHPEQPLSTMCDFTE